MVVKFLKWKMIKSYTGKSGYGYTIIQLGILGLLEWPAVIKNIFLTNLFKFFKVFSFCLKKFVNLETWSI